MARVHKDMEKTLGKSIINIYKVNTHMHKKHNTENKLVGYSAWQQNPFVKRMLTCMNSQQAN